MVTRNGVYYDLSHSKYKYKVPDTGVTFMFSSDLHLVKFQDQQEDNRKEVNIRFTSRFKLNVDLKILPDLILYRKIETRGFLIINERGQKICPENLILSGEQVTLKS
jgi:YHS domain-containing protein